MTDLIDVPLGSDSVIKSDQRPTASQSVQVRPMLQTTLFQALRRWSGSVGDSAGHSLTSIAEKLLVDIQCSSRPDGFVKASDSMETAVRRVLASKTDMSKAKEWVISNNFDKTMSQPAYAEYLNNVKTVCCTCDPEAWDKDASSCDFHFKCEHTLADLTWGLTEVLEEADHRVVPHSVRMVGAAALACAILLKQKVAEAAAQAQADGVKEGKDKDSKDSGPPTLEELVGPYGAFLLKDEGPEGDCKKTLNTALLNLMIGAKACYVLNAMCKMIRRPTGFGFGCESEFISVTDSPRPRALESLLNHLCKAAEGTQYISQIESRFQFLVESSSPDSCEESWSGLWSKVLFHAVSKEAKEGLAAKESKENTDPKAAIATPGKTDWQKMLPSPNKVVRGKSLLAQHASAEEKGAGGGEGVKDELGAVAPDAAAAGKEAAAATTSAMVTTATGQHSLFDVYTLNDLPAAKDPRQLNAMDVLVIGYEIQSYLLRAAATFLGSKAFGLWCWLRLILTPCIVFCELFFH